MKRKSIKIKILVVISAVLIFIPIDVFILKHQLKIDSIITFLCGILPITFLVKLPEKLNFSLKGWKKKEVNE